MRSPRSRSSAAATSRLALGIEIRGRLVEDEQRRVAQERAGERDPPPLARRERPAAVADHRLVAERQRERRTGRAPASSAAARTSLVGGVPSPRAGCSRRPCRGRSSAAAAPRRAARATPRGRTRRDRRRRPSPRPSVGSAKPSSRLAIVLFPAPLSPTSASVSPGRERQVEPVEHRRPAATDTRRRRSRSSTAATAGLGGTSTRPRASGASSISVEDPLGDGEAVGARVELRAELAQRQVQLRREQQHRQPGLQARACRRRAARRR